MKETPRKGEISRPPDTETRGAPSWESVFRHTGLGIALTLPGSDRLARVNDSFAAMHGYATDELEGRALSELTARPRDLGSRRPATPSATNVYRGVHRRRDGSRFAVEVEEVTVREKGGSEPYVVMQVRDITALVAEEEEHRRFEEQVRHTQKLESLGVMAGGIAHDFNNLLMSILANTELALRRVAQDAACHENLERVRDTALRAGELANQMLAYSGRGHFQIRPIDLNQVVRELGDLLRVSLSKKVSLRHGFHPSLPPIDGDPVQLRQVIMNLITNASDAIGDEVGVITVTTGSVLVDRSYLPDVAESTGAGEYVYVEVRDTGTGMTPETVAKIFEPFFTTKLTGRGLGLAAVFGILRGHRGAIRVHSRVGEGTSFVVLFPRRRAMTESDADALQPATELSGTVLIAEDEEHVRNSLSELLRISGCTVLEASDGRQAVKLFDAHADEITAVLLDLTMPELNGRQVLAELRKRRPKVPVVIMSGYAKPDLDEGFSSLERLEFLQKPIPATHLLSTLRRALKPEEEPDGR